MPSIYPPHHIQVSKANAKMLPAEQLSAQLQRQMFSTVVNGLFAVHVLCVIFWDFKTFTFNGGTMNKGTSKDHDGESPSSKHFLQNPAPALCLRALTLLVWHDWSCLGARALAPRERDADSGLGKEPLSLWGCEMCFPVWPWWMGLVAGTKRRIKKADLFEMSNPCKKTTSFPPVRSKARQNPSYPLVSENER